MGITPHEYYCMTRAEFILSVRGYLRRMQKFSFMARENTYATYATQFGRKKPMPAKSKMWPLPMIDQATKLNIDMDRMKRNWQIFKNKK